MSNKPKVIWLELNGPISLPTWDLNLEKLLLIWMNEILELMILKDGIFWAGGNWFDIAHLRFARPPLALAGLGLCSADDAQGPLSRDRGWPKVIYRSWSRERSSISAGAHMRPIGQRLADLGENWLIRRRPKKVANNGNRLCRANLKARFWVKLCLAFRVVSVRQYQLKSLKSQKKQCFVDRESLILIDSEGPTLGRQIFYLNPFLNLTNPTNLE